MSLPTGSFTVQPEAVEALAAELRALAAELADDAGWVRAAAASFAVALGGDEGWTAGARPPPGPACRKSSPTAPRPWPARSSRPWTPTGPRTPRLVGPADPDDRPRSSRRAACTPWPPGTSPSCGARSSRSRWPIDRLRIWRARLDGVQRELESGDCWSGPAARSAAAALADGVGGDVGRRERPRRVAVGLRATGHRGRDTPRTWQAQALAAGGMQPGDGELTATMRLLVPDAAPASGGRRRRAAPCGRRRGGRGDRR